MGLLISKIFGNFKQEKKIVMVGLDAAGKSTILYKLKLGEVINSVPTVGFNVERVEYKNISFTVWDIGGQTLLRKLWRHYYDNCDAIIFVVDSSDLERFELAKETLQELLADSALDRAKLLVYANKQDMANITTQELAQKLDLSSLRGRDWYIQGTCGLTGDGLIDGLEWLSKTLKHKEKY